MNFGGRCFVAVLLGLLVSEGRAFDLKGFLQSQLDSVSITLTNSYNTFVDEMKDIFENVLHRPKRYKNEYPGVLKNVRFAPTSFQPKTTQPSTEVTSSIPGTVRKEPIRILPTPEILLSYGYQAETHTLLTEDGYFLVLHRIVPKNDNKGELSNQTILLHHGLLGSSADWLLLGPNKSLAFMLADAGCDVWLANARGNVYSRSHAKLSSESKLYWKFSFEEMGKYDFPAIVDHIMKYKKKHSVLNFIGHSMGASAFLVFCATYPDINQVFSMGILMGPLAFMSEVRGPLLSLSKLNSENMQRILDYIGRDEFFPNGNIPTLNMPFRHCLKSSEVFCRNPLYFLMGDAPEVGSEAYHFHLKAVDYVPAGGSTNTILHYARLVKTGRFHPYYGSVKKNEYRLGDVTVPIVLMSSTSDSLANVRDVFKLYFAIAKPLDHHIFTTSTNISHADFVWGANTDTVVNKQVLKYLLVGASYNSTSDNEIDFAST